MTKYIVGIDIGGTFTDLALWDGERCHTAKVPSTPPDYANGVLEALDQLFSGKDFRDISFFIHGTTAGLNAFLERRGAKTALLTTKGFRDVYEIGRMNRTDMYNIFFQKPKRLVSRANIFEVCERIMADGTIRTPIDREVLEDIVEKLQNVDITSVAVCFLHGYTNPVHEQTVRDILKKRLPNVSVSTSHQVAPEWREYERTSTTVLNAYIAPEMDGYLGILEDGLENRLFDGKLYIMQSSGGVMSTQAARHHAVRTLMSGPVGGAVGSRELGLQIDEPNLICADMGGTSFDVSLTINGESETRTQVDLEGFPVLTPMIAIHSVGAGGGSIAHMTDGGLRVGPASAGANPGPVCYGRGGTQPTVTDANLVLGRIDPENFLGGTMKLNQVAAENSIEDLAQALNLAKYDLAHGILEVANAKMANAIRTITVSRGIDPRDFALVAFGGAGPMHAVFLAEELGIPRVIVPAMSGIFSAWGMLHTDIYRDFTRSYFKHYTAIRASDIEQLFCMLEKEGRELLISEGVSNKDQMKFFRTADMRYVGQEFFINVQLPEQIDKVALASLPDSFHQAYRQRYGYVIPSKDLELVNLRLRAVGRFRPEGLLGVSAAPEKKPNTSQRDVFFNGEWMKAAVLQRTSLSQAYKFEGPAIVEDPSYTAVVPMTFHGSVDRYGNLILSKS